MKESTEEVADHCHPGESRRRLAFFLAALGGMVVLLAGTAVGWSIPVLYAAAFAGALILAVANIFRDKPSALLVLAFAAVWGTALGSTAAVLDPIVPGLTLHLIAGTSAGILGPLAFFLRGRPGRTLVHLAASLALYWAAVAVLAGGGILEWPSEGGAGPAWAILGCVAGCLAASWVSRYFGNHLREIEGSMRFESEPGDSWRSAFGVLITLAFVLLGAQ